MSTQTKSRYLEYLPAIYHEDPFLGQFLLPFEEVLTGFEDLLSTVDRYFAPALTDTDPENFLPWLATWVALVLDEEWDEAKRRRLIGEAVKLYRLRGTVEGLKGYLKIYTGLVPEIREWRWPGGMQIGVASQIGGTTPKNASLGRIERAVRSEPLVYHDYYVVDTVAPVGYTVEIDGHAYNLEGQPLRLYYRADRVERVEIGKGYVDIKRFGEEPIHHEPATVTRRDGLIDDHYTLTVRTESETRTVEYTGDTLLVDEVELPYRFVVDVRVPLADVENVKLDKVRAIVDLEKPAHTMYYLKLTPVVSEFVLKPMQIEVRSTIGVDTILG